MNGKKKDHAEKEHAEKDPLEGWFSWSRTGGNFAADAGPSTSRVSDKTDKSRDTGRDMTTPKKSPKKSEDTSESALPRTGKPARNSVRFNVPSKDGEDSGRRRRSEPDRRGLWKDFKRKFGFS